LPGRLEAPIDASVPRRGNRCLSSLGDWTRVFSKAIDGLMCSLSLSLSLSLFLSPPPRRRRNKNFSCTSINLIFPARTRARRRSPLRQTICYSVQEHADPLATRIWEKGDEILPRRHEKSPGRLTLRDISKHSISHAGWIFPRDDNWASRSNIRLRLHSTRFPSAHICIYIYIYFLSPINIVE